MIEQKIDELIAAMDRLTVALGAATPETSPASTPKVKAKPAPEPEPAPAATPKAKTLSAADMVADIENRCRMLSRKDPKPMRAAIMAILDGYDSKTIKGVPESKLAELSDKIAELEA